ncbi:MAG TPA: DinB family protein, partial [Rubrivivax sp.]|nr:DinB family protein [Rubrivivax sp.]
MTPALCALMAEYNRWINLRLYDAAARLSEPEIMEDRRAFFGSLFNTLTHIVVADLLWLHRFARHQGLQDLGRLMAGFPKPTTLRDRVACSLPELRDVRTRADGVISELAGVISEHHLSQTLRYSNTAGEQQAKNFGLLLLHFF